MKRLNHRRTRAPPMMVTELVLASSETVARRTAMIGKKAGKYNYRSPMSLSTHTARLVCEQTVERRVGPRERH